MKRKTSWDSRFCPDCQTDVDTVHDRCHGDLVCSECGLVLHSGMLEDCEECRIFYEDGQDRSRVGGPSSFVQPGHALPGSEVQGGVQLSTVVARGRGGGGGGGPGAAPDVSRGLVRVQMSANGSSEKLKAFVADRAAMMDAMRGSLLCMAYDSGAFNFAISLFSIVSGAKPLFTAEKPAVQAACVYCACAARHEPKDVATVCCAFGVDESELRAALKKLHAVVDSHPDLTEKERSEIMCTSTNHGALVMTTAAEMNKSVPKADLWPLQHLARWIMDLLRDTGTLDGCQDSIKCVAAVVVAARHLRIQDHLHPLKLVAGAKGRTVDTIKKYIKNVSGCVAMFEGQLEQAATAAVASGEHAFKRKYGVAPTQETSAPSKQ